MWPSAPASLRMHACGQGRGGLKPTNAAPRPPTPAPLPLPLCLQPHLSPPHPLAGKLAALELHIVTRADPNATAWVPERCRTELCLAVFGVLVELGADPEAPGAPFLQQVVDNLPSAPGKAVSCAGGRLPASAALVLHHAQASSLASPAPPQPPAGRHQPDRRLHRPVQPAA